MEDRVGTIVRDSNSISTCPIYKIQFYIFLLNCLGYGPPSLGLLAKWADSLLAPLFLSSESMIRGTNGTRYHHRQPLKTPRILASPLDYKRRASTPSQDSIATIFATKSLFLFPIHED
jgi:hypothetical protein